MDAVDPFDKVLNYTYAHWQPMFDFMEEMDTAITDEEQIYGQVSRFITMAYSIDIVIPFDWSDWYNDYTPIGSYIQTHDITLIEACKLLTSLIRADRFMEGTLMKYMTNGVIHQLLDTMKQTLDATQEE